MSAHFRLQEADIGAGPVIITSQREKVVDFTRPFLRVTPTVLIHKPHHAEISSIEVSDNS